MGRPMALNLLKGGHALRVNARRPESMQPLKEAGATACASPAEAARGSEVIFTMVSDTPDVEQVIFGPGGVAEGAARGSVIVDMSTISPVVTRSLAARLAEGVEMLDPSPAATWGRSTAPCRSWSAASEVFGRAAAVRMHGQNIAHRSHRPGRQGLQSDRGSGDARVGRRGADLGAQERRRSGQGARGAARRSPGARSWGPRPPHRRARLQPGFKARLHQRTCASSPRLRHNWVSACRKRRSSRSTSMRWSARAVATRTPPQWPRWSKR